MATAAVVSFATVRGVGSINSPGVGDVRSQTTMATLPGVTTDTAQAGEVAIVGNAGTSMVAIAYGSVPDAAATASTAVTGAGFPLAPGAVALLPVRTGDKVSVKALP